MTALAAGMARDLIFANVFLRLELGRFRCPFTRGKRGPHAVMNVPEIGIRIAAASALDSDYSLTADSLTWNIVKGIGLQCTLGFERFPEPGKKADNRLWRAAGRIVDVAKSEAAMLR